MSTDDFRKATRYSGTKFSELNDEFCLPFTGNEVLSVVKVANLLTCSDC